MNKGIQKVEKDLVFIAQQLDKYTDKRCIVLFHVPPPTDLSSNHMKDHIECLMCGHIHGFRDYVIDGYRVFITGGGGARLDDLEKDTVKAHHAIKMKIDQSTPVSFEVIRV